MAAGTVGARLSLLCEWAGELAPSSDKARAGAASLRVEQNSGRLGLDFGFFMFGICSGNMACCSFDHRGRFVHSIGFHSLSERKLAGSNMEKRVTGQSWRVGRVT